MNRDLDHLDAAIDHVAKRLVAVPGNEAELTQQIISVLPDRSSRLRWLIPQFVALGAIVIAAFAWTTRDESPTQASRPSGHQAIGPSGPQGPVATIVSASPLAPLSPLASSMTNQNPFFRTQPSEPSEPQEPPEPLRESSDFDNSLPPIAPMNALALSDVTLRAIEAPAAIELAPIEISEIPTPADVPPRQQE